MGQGQVIPLAWTMYPTKANIAMRPCLTSDSLKNPMVSLSVVPQKLDVESPRGSKRGTTGLSFLARSERSSRVSILSADVEETEVAPFNVEGVNAAAVPARMDAIASFMFSVGLGEMYALKVSRRNRANQETGSLFLVSSFVTLKFADRDLLRYD